MRIPPLFLAPVLACGAGFTGPQSCQPCHAAQYARQWDTHHARALRPMAQSPLAEHFDGQPLRERSGIGFEYRATPAGVAVAITQGQTRVDALLGWAFGAGSKAFTAVGMLDGRYVEHRISWYRGSGRFGLTLGHPAQPSPDPATAFGLVQEPGTIFRCFNCHATGVRETPRGPDLAAMIPGVTCERCHGPGQAHVDAAKAGTPPRNSILNPGRFSARQLVNVCAECHRSPNATNASPMPELEDPLSIRFAPVGLMASRCFQKSNALSCVSCHDPHEDPKPAEDPAYSRVCRTCHTTRAGARAACRRSQAGVNCLGCHMRQAAPAPNLSFTDHRIRVYER